MEGKKVGIQKTPQDFEIPVPKRDDVFRVLEKAVKPVKPSTLLTKVAFLEMGCF